MLCREIIAVCSQIHTKHINTLCGQKKELLNVKPGGTNSDHCALYGYVETVCTIYNTNYLCAVCGESWEGHRCDGWLGTTGCLSAVSRVGVI